MNLSKFNVDDLINRKLVTVKRYPEQGLRVLKYHKKVFWNNLWDTDVRLLDCRGTIVDDNDNIVTMPFTKVFNLNENGTAVDCSRSITAIRKVNGFMAAASMHNGLLLVSTTGTIDSDYAEIARKHIGDICPPENHTAIFEICDQADPHIVDEIPGAYLIGARYNAINSPLFTERNLDELARLNGFKRPHHENMIMNQCLNLLKTTTHEGFMVRDANTGDVLCKLKSPHYLAKKFFMRMSKNKLESIWGDQQLARKVVDEEYYPLIEWLASNYTLDQWRGIEEQKRRFVIEEYLQCQH